MMRARLFAGVQVLAITIGAIVLAQQVSDGRSGNVLASPGVCAGDCNGDGRTSSNEAVVIFHIAVENPDVPASACPAADVNGTGKVDVNDAVFAFNISTEFITCDLRRP
jgi:hypothetical protein